jgi:hypothetical protein
VTHTALVTTSILQRIRTHKPSPFLNLMVTLLMFFADTYKSVFRWARLIYGGLELFMLGCAEAVSLLVLAWT